MKILAACREAIRNHDLDLLVTGKWPCFVPEADGPLLFTQLADSKSLTGSVVPGFIGAVKVPRSDGPPAICGAIRARR